MNMSDPLARERASLARWLAEWELDRRLLAGVGAGSFDAAQESWDAFPAAHAVPSASVATVDYRIQREALRCGEIRLMAPVAGLGAAERPLYVAVLEAVGEGGFRVAPFSRFAEPATPAEWRTGLRAAPVRVLCLWNACVVPSTVLRRSWRGSRFAPAKRRRAMEIWRGLPAASELHAASSGAADVGPRLLHPADPRWEYLAGEAACMEETFRALSASLVGQTHPAGGKGFLYEQSADPELRKAAEPRGEYGKGKRGSGRQK